MEIITTTFAEVVNFSQQLLFVRNTVNVAYDLVILFSDTRHMGRELNIYKGFDIGESCSLRGSEFCLEK